MPSPPAFASPDISMSDNVRDTKGTSLAPPRAARKTTRKAYTCRKCMKVFTSSSHLTRHDRIHTGVKEHVCPFPGCVKECTRVDNLVQHFRIHLPKFDRKRGDRYTRSCMDQVQADLQASSDHTEPLYSPTAIEEQVDARYVVLRSDADATAQRPPSSSYDTRPVPSSTDIELSPIGTASSFELPLYPESPSLSTAPPVDAFTHQVEMLRMEDVRQHHQFDLETDNPEFMQYEQFGDYVYEECDTHVVDFPASQKPMYEFERSLLWGSAT